MSRVTTTTITTTTSTRTLWRVPVGRDSSRYKSHGEVVCFALFSAVVTFRSAAPVCRENGTVTSPAAFFLLTWLLLPFYLSSIFFLFLFSMSFADRRRREGREEEAIKFTSDSPGKEAEEEGSVDRRRRWWLLAREEVEEEEGTNFLGQTDRSSSSFLFSQT